MSKYNRDSEKWLERALSDYVSDGGGASIKLLSTLQNGMPDRMVLWDGGGVEFVELKSKGKKVSLMQQAVRAQLVNLGFKYTVIDSEKSFKEWQNLPREPTKPI